MYTAKFTSDVPPKFNKAKARLVANDNFEQEPDDVWENLSPTSGAQINRFFDAYCVGKGFEILSTDCTKAFLNADIEKPVFIRPPRGFQRPGKCLRLLKHLYGLRSAPRAWLDLLSGKLQEIGFQPFDDEPCLLRYSQDDSEIVVQVYVDDIKWGTNNVELTKQVIEVLNKSFPLTFDGPVRNYLGMLYEYDRARGVMSVNQTAYVDKVIKRFELDDEEVKIPDAPLPPMSSLDDLPNVFKRKSQTHVEQRAQDWSEKFSFPMIIGSLIHAMVHTRPDIAYALSVLSRFMAKPELHHYKAANYLLRNLKGTNHIGLRYDRDEINRSLKEMQNILSGAVDSSFADCLFIVGEIHEWFCPVVWWMST